jgi:hypothetical protein
MNWAWGLLLVLAPASAILAQNETTKTQARQIDTVLGQLYPGQDIAAKMGQPALGQAPASGAAPTTATLVVRRPKRRAADRPTSPTLNLANPSVTLDEPSSGTRPSNPAPQAGTGVTLDRGPKRPDLDALIDAPLAAETPPTMKVTQTNVPTRTASAASVTSKTSAVKPTPGPPLEGVRVNGAGAGELGERLKLDGRRARNIVEFRELYGPFQRPEDLSQVSGITDDMVRHWEEQRLLIFN